MNQLAQFVDTVRSYLVPILQERFWSWSLVGIVYLIAGMIVRWWFLSPVISKAKELDSDDYREIQRAYLKRSVPGWIFFFLSFLIFVAVWNQDILIPPPMQQVLALGAALLSFVFSIVFHLQAFAKASVICLVSLRPEKHIRDLKEKK